MERKREEKHSLLLASFLIGHATDTGNPHDAVPLHRTTSFQKHGLDSPRAIMCPPLGGGEGSRWRRCLCLPPSDGCGVPRLHRRNRSSRPGRAACLFEPVSFPRVGIAPADGGKYKARWVSGRGTPGKPIAWRREVNPALFRRFFLMCG